MRLYVAVDLKMTLHSADVHCNHLKYLSDSYRADLSFACNIRRQKCVMIDWLRRWGGKRNDTARMYCYYGLYIDSPWWKTCQPRESQSWKDSV